MSSSAGRAAFGGCLGVVLGGLLGGVIGFLIADSYQPQTLFDATRPLIFLTAVAFGAISGAAAGAAAATRLGPGVPRALPGQNPRDPRSPPEAPEIELARLKERVAELEAGKRREGQQ